MSAKELLVKILTFGFYSTKWRCNACGKENFNGKFFCDECESKLPYNDKATCEHCGRALKAAANYCSTCKERLVSVDKARSVFIYDKPISTLIKNAKYRNRRFVFDYFSDKLAVYLTEKFGDAEAVTFVPATEKRVKARGFNQSELLAKGVAEKSGVPFVDCVIKKEETERQAKLSKSDRLKNLKGAFKVRDKNLVRGKNIVVIDDVSTTGATGETIAETLKKAGALRVYLLTVASVPPKNGF
ncbi:MAG: ComF family protein [Clostridia bacterium]|nr:ComF family protein [Clostridia bacterium]